MKKRYYSTETATDVAGRRPLDAAEPRRRCSSCGQQLKVSEYESPEHRSCAMRDAPGRDWGNV
jgi:hypothetical protein